MVRLNLSSLQEGGRESSLSDEAPMPSTPTPDDRKSESSRVRQSTRGTSRFSSCASSMLGSMSMGDSSSALIDGRGPMWAVDAGEIDLRRRLGAGAFGEVYEARWRRKRCAVKRLLTHVTAARLEPEMGREGGGAREAGRWWRQRGALTRWTQALWGH